MTRSVVADSCLAVKWLIAQQDSDKADALLTFWTANSVQILVPALFVSEVSNTIYRYVQRGRAKGAADSITLVGAQLLTKAVLDIVYVVAEDAALVNRAAELAFAWDRPTLYDSLFAALAEREGCIFWTADEKFINGTQGRCPWVRHLRSYSHILPGPAPER